MDSDERKQIEQVLEHILRDDWDEFLARDEGEHLRERLDAVREALKRSGHLSLGAPPKPTSEIVDLFGYRLLSDSAVGPWLRFKILQRAVSSTKWDKLAAQYRELVGSRAESLHGNMTQEKAGSRVMASYWRQGGPWARAFCELTGLPEMLAKSRASSLPADEEISPVEPLTPLHDFQLEVYSSMREMLANGTGSTGLMSLPTGAGKTRVAVEAICDHLVEHPHARKSKNIVLWIAQSEELQLQAWECFRQVWQVPPQRSDEKQIRRTFPLRIVGLWGGRNLDEVEILDEPTVLIAGIAQLDSWVERRPEFFEDFPVPRLLCVVVDEAHKVVTKSQRDVLVALRLRAKHEWRALQNAPPVFGLSATPWRSDDDESATLRRYFQKSLLRPESLRTRPIAVLQQREILAQVDPESLDINNARPMNEKQQQQFEQFGELPADYVEELGMEHERNARILKRLVRLHKRAKVLVFACSIAHAEILAVALNQALGNDSAAVVTGKTPRAERAAIIERFKEDGGLRFLCNVNVLTTGFDAPRADTICITRPTTSALLYEQMVGRGLRGPKNGGTSKCLVIDVQDSGMPEGIQSYARVLRLWDG